MKKYFTLIGITLLLCSACSRESGIIRKVQPVERLDVEIREDGSGLIRTVFADISFRPITASEWVELGSFDVFHTEVDEEQRMPPFTCLLIGIRNISPMPITMSGLHIITSRNTIRAWYPDEVADYFFGPCYVRPDLKLIFLPRRIHSDKLPLFEDIDFDKTLLYDFPSIMPGDTVVMFRALPWVPLDERRYTISADFILSTLKKTVAIDMQRFEYRRKGTYFNEPEEPGKNNDGY